jgi:hypothetical protein
MVNNDEAPQTPVEWPNKQDVVDGVIPTRLVDQTPDLFTNITDHTSVEMKG